MIDVAGALRRARAALGLDLEVLASAAGLDAGTLDAYERGTRQIPGDVLWSLSDLLGIPLEDVDSEATLARHLQVMAVRFRADPRAIPDRVRLAVARAASAARDYVDLEVIAERPSRYQGLVEQWPRQPEPPRREIWKSGRELATTVRGRLGLDGTVPSMLNLVEKHLRALVIWQKLPVDIAGYAFCDELHGPAVVLNVNGRNQNELVRRFTLAHEACHVLFDRYDVAALSRFDGYDDFHVFGDDARDPHEVRANAFAIHLLAPERPFHDVWTRERDVRRTMLAFGTSFEATRAHLGNYGLLPFGERVTGVATSPSDEWKAAESSELWYPAFDDIPIERRHAVARLAFELWVKEAITTGRLREALRAHLTHDQLRELAELYVGTLVA